MAATVEERLSDIEARMDEIEAELAQTRSRARKHPGVTIEEAREILKTPAEYGPEEIALFRRVIGSFDGPEDLAENMRDYLYGERA